MLRTITSITLVIGVVIHLSGCIQSCTLPPTQISAPVENNTTTLTTCPEKRPEVCTFDYRPVCATRDTGIRCVTTPCASTEQKTYGNACSACADEKVIGYIPDECAAASTTNPPK